MKFLSKMALVAGMIIVLCAFPGCASQQPKNLQQTALLFKTDLDAAIKVGNLYGALVYCDVPAHPPACSQANIVLQINRIEHKAADAIELYRATVYDPAFVDNGSNAAKLQVAAANALLELLALTNPVAPIVNQPMTSTKGLTP